MSIPSGKGTPVMISALFAVYVSRLPFQKHWLLPVRKMTSPEIYNKLTQVERSTTVDLLMEGLSMFKTVRAKQKM